MKQDYDFLTPKDGRRWRLVGSHSSTVPLGGEPKRKKGCAGCEPAAA